MKPERTRDGAGTATLAAALGIALLAGYCVPDGGNLLVTHARADEAQVRAEILTTVGVVGSMERDGTLVIITAERKSVVTYVRPETEITRNGGPATIADLKVGDAVKAGHYAGGGLTSLSATGR